MKYLTVVLTPRCIELNREPVILRQKHETPELAVASGKKSFVKGTRVGYVTDKNTKQITWSE